MIQSFGNMVIGLAKMKSWIDSITDQSLLEDVCFFFFTCGINKYLQAELLHVQLNVLLSQFLKLLFS